MKCLFLFRFCFLLLLLLSFTFNYVFAQVTLYATIGNGDTMPPTSDLVVIDQITGNISNTIGNLGYLVNGLTYDSVEGNLYATTSFNDPNFPNGLLNINLETGNAVEIGMGFGTIYATLASNSSGQLFTWSPYTGSLAIVDKGTGTISAQFATNILPEEFGSAFDANDTLWLFDGGTSSVYRVETMGPMAGSVTYTGSIGSMTERSHHGSFHPETGEYWGISETGNSFPKYLNMLELPSGNLVGSVSAPDFIHTLAFAQKTVVVGGVILSAKKKKDKFLTETDHINVLNWALTPGSSVEYFRIVRNGERVVEVPGSVTSYDDHNRKKNGTDSYVIRGVVGGSIISSNTVVI